MKPLILSFFAVILGYSLLFNKKEEVKQDVQKNKESVYMDRPTNIQKNDTTELFKDKVALAKF